MSEISDYLKNENHIPISDCLVNDIREEREASDISHNEIIKIISDMVEITSKKLAEGNEKKTELVSNIIADNAEKETFEQKPQNDINIIAENDLPVRRSNRIRKSAVKKDEFVVPRTKKANRSQKTTDLMDIKVIEKNDSSNIKNTHKNNESPNQRCCEGDLKQSSVGNNFNEPSNKVLTNKFSKSKSHSKPGKVQKVKQKSIQNGKRSTQTEKKKPLRQKKKCDKSQESTDPSDSDNVVHYEGKEDGKTEILTFQSQTLLSSKVLQTVSNLEDNKSEKFLSLVKSCDDHSCDTVEKLPESCNIKPVKVKSRWWRSSELEAVMNSESVTSECTVNLSSASSENVETQPTEGSLENVKEEIVEEIVTDEIKVICPDSASPVYDHIEENIYRFNRKKCKSKKQVRRMVCDCTLTKEEQEYGVLGCKEECLNRLLMIECGSRCPIGEACSNKKFQNKEYVKAEIFKTEKKGWGLRTLEDISAGDFLIEFVGEILNHKEYRQRVKQYAKEKNVHSYFMAMKPDEILDATVKGNLSRFINHSCYPNCETQKWTVNGELRVGVFSKQALHAGEELTLDYKFQRYGREAQKCYCGAENCSGFIGGAKQISIDAYSGKSVQPRKRKGSEDKKREWEDLILEEEIEKLNGNRGLRNREDTLKLARLMVRADDATSRHQLLNIILKTEEQACLRLFLDYHGLPLLWSWMADVTELELKAKILQVLSLLPISNKTMLLDSKVMSIVEKWNIECASKFQPEIELEAEKSSPVVICDEASDSVAKKLKLPDLSDSETDSTSSHTVVDTSNETNSTVPDVSTKIPVSAEAVSQSESSQENLNDGKQMNTVEEDPDSSLKTNIASLASGLLNNWKNLKEVFRIPRLEQQKRKEDEMEVDNNAKEKVENECIDDNTKCGDQIQVVISGKNVFSDHHRAYDYEQPEVKLEDCPRRFCQPRTPSVLAKPRQINKPVRRHVFPKQIESEISQHKPKEDISKGSGDILPNALPPGPLLRRPPLIATPPFSNQPPITYPPPANVPVPPHQPVENPSSLIYPPHIIYPQSQLPFVGSPAPILPHNPAAMPPPTSVTSQSPLIQQPPMNAGIPPCQPIPPNQPNVGGPPNPNSFLLPPNVPPSSVVPGTSQFIPNQTAPMQTFPPGGNVFTNQNQPLYFLPQPTSLPNNPPPAVTFTENVPIQQPSVTFSVQTVVPVKEEPKPIKLPKNWRTATDSEGNVYYYHSITRQTQWDPPSEEDDSDEDDDEEDSNSEESESSDTPTYDEPKVISSKHSRKKSKKRKPTKAAADTSVVPIRPEVAKKIKELFRTKMSSFIVHCLNAYRKPDCTVGRITSNDDFKYLARKLTHYTMTKELKQCKNVEDLDCNETVMHKAKDFIKKYMAKYGSQYIRKEKLSPAEE